MGQHEGRSPRAIDARSDLRRGVEDRWKGVDDVAQRALVVADGDATSII
jgi:hypothetical protein